MQRWIVGLLGANAIMLICCGTLGFFAYDQSQRVDALELRLSSIRSEIGNRPDSVLGAFSLWGAVESSRKTSELFVELPAKSTDAKVSLIESEVKLLKLEQRQLWQSIGGQFADVSDVRVNCFKTRMTGRIECREP